QRGLQSSDYPHTVATTWSLSFQKIRQTNPVAAELLCLCAFLAPDAIPEDLISSGVSYWSPPLQQAATNPFALDQAIAELLKFSLVKRDAQTETLHVHRLVQVVIKEAMEQSIRHRWAEQVTRAVNNAFPSGANLLDVAVWPQCFRYLSQAQGCALLIEQYTLLFSEAVELLGKTAIYLLHHALYSIVE